jgi:hypothetical protein
MKSIAIILIAGAGLLHADDDDCEQALRAARWADWECRMDEIDRNFERSQQEARDQYQKYQEDAARIRNQYNNRDER